MQVFGLSPVPQITLLASTGEALTRSTIPLPLVRTSISILVLKLIGATPVLVGHWGEPVGTSKVSAGSSEDRSGDLEVPGGP